MTTKMPSESPVLPAQTEKPPHYMYLKEFRTQQCPLFLQHKCTQHRPFTCFHWHFMNQRRRRPVRKRDGTFNYSPDIYCTKFDETTGICPEGDDCPLLHRTAGDTERRYHLRYYKTGTCVYETDAKGHCVKNGPHCAFAHGPLDLRPPVYDMRELQTMEQGSSDISSSPGTPSSSSLEKDRTLLEDPRWNDTNFVLANYKTEGCKKPPRLCRQGYACPQFHNSRDRRRSPKIHKYRSTPCPNVKHGDDWGDPAQCENNDNCGYCHTRTEQQFHPEIYKSTKCNDMVQNNYCPRGPFCAFAHVEQEMTTQRELPSQGSVLLAAMISNLLPQSSVSSSIPNSLATSLALSVKQTVESSGTNGVAVNSTSKMPDPIGKERLPNTTAFTAVNSYSTQYGSSLPEPLSSSYMCMLQAVNCTNSIANSQHSNHTGSPLPEPIGGNKKRSNSTSSSITSNDSGGCYQKAPGSEREDIQQLKLRQQLQAIDNDVALDAAEKAKRKQNLMLVHSLPTSNMGIVNMSQSIPITTAMSPYAPAFYPPRDTVGSVIEQALEDITLDDIDINNLEKELDNDTNSLSSSISAGLSSGFGSSSIPIGIPPCSIPRGSVGSLSQSPPSPYGSFPHSILPMHTHKESINEVSWPRNTAPPSPYGSFPNSILPIHTHKESINETSYLGQHNHMKFSGSPFGEVNSMSPRSGPGGPHSPLYSHSVTNSLNSSGGGSDLQKLQSDIITYKSKLEHWEQAYNQAKAACEAWKKEAEEGLRKTKATEEEKQTVVKQRDEALNQYKKLKMAGGSGQVQIMTAPSNSNLETLMLPQLHQIQQQLRSDLDRVEQMIYKQTALKCVICQDKNRCIATSPCNHCVMCDKCAPMKSECPLCRAGITQRATVNYHL